MSIRRFEAIQKFIQLLIKYKSREHYKRAAYSEAARVCGIPEKTLQRWRNHFRRYGLRGLIDTRGKAKRRKNIPPLNMVDPAQA